MPSEAPDPNPASRIALFGGSFNPPHVAHLAVAEAAAEEVGLVRVLWMPAATPPHKRGDRTVVSAQDRLAMTRLAVEGNPRFAVYDGEVRRGGVSYTVDTLRALRVEHPAAELLLLLGGDSLAGFPTWREPLAILELARLVVYRRPGFTEADVPAEVLTRIHFVDAVPLELSGTAIRARLAAGRTVRYLVPDGVVAYAEAHGLYREEGGGGKVA